MKIAANFGGHQFYTRKNGEPRNNHCIDRPLIYRSIDGPIQKNKTQDISKKVLQVFQLVQIFHLRNAVVLDKEDLEPSAALLQALNPLQLLLVQSNLLQVRKDAVVVLGTLAVVAFEPAAFGSTFTSPLELDTLRVRSFRLSYTAVLD